jgi:hypothetical protein
MARRPRLLAAGAVSRDCAWEPQTEDVFERGRLPVARFGHRMSGNQNLTKQAACVAAIVKIRKPNPGSPAQAELYLFQLTSMRGPLQ